MTRSDGSLINFCCDQPPWHQPQVINSKMHSKFRNSNAIKVNATIAMSASAVQGKTGTQWQHAAGLLIKTELSFFSVIYHRFSIIFGF